VIPSAAKNQEMGKISPIGFFEKIKGLDDEEIKRLCDKNPNLFVFLLNGK